MPVTLMELEPRHCRYIVCETPSLYCGERRQAGSSYCPDHHAVCWIKTKRQVRARLPLSIPVDPVEVAPSPAPADPVVAVEPPELEELFA